MAKRIRKHLPKVGRHTYINAQAQSTPGLLDSSAFNENKKINQNKRQNLFAYNIERLAFWFLFSL